MSMTDLLRNHRLALFAVFSSGLVAAVVLNALQNHSNFFAAAFAMSQSNGSVMAMLNMALVATVIFGIGVQKLFFGELRALEIERLHERSWYFMTEIFLAFTAFRDQFSVTHAVMLLQLLFIKCFHWLLSDRIEAIDQLPYPGPKMIDHFRLVSLMLILWIIDVVVLTYALDAVMQDGISIVVLFVNEYAILCVAVIHSALKYCLHVYELLRARTRGGATAPPWEDKSLYNFYIDLATSFTEVMIYLSYFTILTVLYTIPFHAIRDVYISIRYLATRTMDFIRYRKAVKNMKDKYPDAGFEELRDMNDKTCIICRDELIFRGTPPATENIEGEQPPLPLPATNGLNDTPKKLPCGHIFHSHCLRSWLERQQTCPTCRRSVLEQLPAMQNAAPQPAQRGGPNQAAINQAVANDPLLARLIGQRQQQQQGGHGQQPVQAGHAPPIAGAPQPGAAPGRPPANAIPGAHVFLAGAADARQVVVQPAPDVLLRDPRRFEGFYLMPNAYAQWGGGALLPRDPTQPAFVPQVPQPAAQRNPQLSYGPGAFALPQPHAPNFQTPDPSRGTEANTNLPPTPAVQSTQPPTSLSWQPVCPPTPRLNAALDASSSRRSSMSTSSSSSTSSEEVASAPATPTEKTPSINEDLLERRRTATEAVLRRHHTTRQKGTPGQSTSINLPSPASLGFRERPIASPSKSIFTSDKPQIIGQEAAASNQPRSSLFTTSASTSARAAVPTPTIPAAPATPAASTPSASTIMDEKQTSAATIVLPGVASPQGAGANVRSLFGGMTGEQYGVRTDAPSFIPLYNNFTPQPAYGPAGPMQPWAHRPSLAGQPTTQAQTIRANSPFPPQLNTPVVPSQHAVTSPSSRTSAPPSVTPSVSQTTPTLQLPTPSSLSRQQPMESYRTPVALARPPESEVRLNGEDWNAWFAQQHQARQRHEVQSSALRGPTRPSRPVGPSSPLSSSPSAPNGVGPSGSASIRPFTPADLPVRDVDEMTKRRIADQLRVLKNVEQMTRRAIAELQSVQGRFIIPPGELAESIARSLESRGAPSTAGLNSGDPPSTRPPASTRQGHERETSDDSLVDVGSEEAPVDVKETGTEGSTQKSEEAATELPYYSC